ncbi:MAG: tetratricopeptide repeat protein, partial [Trichodesmium sp. MAG_R01]|nr:tetratricopeptide repeat protein [Trichodesmium sp. MAG_R01]
MEPKLKYEFCQRLGDSLKNLALYLGIPLKERKTWQPGSECEEILEWLKNRDRLKELPEALEEIEREDLVDLIQKSQPSDPLYQFFEVPPTETEIQNVNQDDVLAFFRGYSDSWGPIQSGIPLSRRVRQEKGTYFDLNQFIEKLFLDSQLKFVKIFGPGGSGKTTFAKMLALKLARHQYCPTVLLRNLEEGKIPQSGVKGLAQKLSQDNKRLFLVYDNPIASDQIREIVVLVKSFQETRNVVIIILEREDEWLDAHKRAGGRRGRGERSFFLEEQLGSNDIEELCQTIERLESNSQNTRILSENRDINDFRQSLIQGNQDILLVAMYEATTGEKIEETIMNEFDGIPNEEAKKLYEFICGLICYSIQFPRDLARFLYGTKLRDIKSEHLAGIIDERRGLLFPRHKTIAEILWRERNADYETEMETLAEYLTELSYRRGDNNSINLDGFSSQVFKLLTTHPNLKPISLRFLIDIVDGLSNVIEYESTVRLYKKAGQYLEKQGETGRAISLYKKILEKYPSQDGLVRSLVLLSKALQKAGDFQQAIDVLREGLQKIPNSELYVALSQALLKQENGLDDAIAVLRQGIQKIPDPHLYLDLSQLLQKRKNGLDEAIAVLRQGIQNIPNHELYVALSKALLKQENGLDEAIAVLRQGIQ